MKKIIICFLVTSYSTFAQNDQFLSFSDIQLSLHSRNIPITANLDSTFVFRHAQLLLNISPLDEIEIKKSRVDKKYGFQTIRAKQLHNSVPIYESEIIFHFSRNGFLTKVNGLWFQESNFIDEPIQVTAELAKEIALKQFNESDILERNDELVSNLKLRSDQYIVSPELVYFKDQLTWKMDVWLINGISQRIFVSSNNGSIVQQMPLGVNCSNTSVNTPWYGTSGTISTYYSGGLYYMLDDCYLTHEYDLVVYNNNQISDPNNYSWYSSSDNIWSTSPNEIVAGTTMWTMHQFRDYLDEEFERDSWDDNGSYWFAYANAGWNGNGNNAYFNGWYTQFGYGTSTSSANDDFISYDIVAHEFGHGVTFSESGLEYEDESGALNESFSDIFGECSEEFAEGNNDWFVGDEIGTLRSFSDPDDYSTPYGGPMPDTYFGDDWYSGNEDNGGVHHNSSVQNFMFYLLTEGGTGTNDNGNDYDVNGIGINDSRRIAYYANVDWLFPTANFDDSREAWLSAAEDLFGSSSSEFQAVEDAWCAVGVGSGCGGQADLISEIWSAEPTTLSPGQTFYITVNTINIGDGDAGTSHTGFYLSEDQVWSTADGDELDETSTAALNPGDDDDDDDDFEIPLGYCGDYYLLAVANHQNEIEESNQSNNASSVSIFIDCTVAPVANFSADNLFPVNQTDIVHFTDLSLNSPNQWTWTINPTTYYYVNGTSQTSKNPYVIFTSGGEYDITLLAGNSGGSDQITKSNYIEAQFGVGIQDLERHELEVFPNPSNGDIHIILGMDEPAQIKIFNSIGQEVWSNHKQSNSKSGEVSLELNQFGSGWYILQVEQRSIVERRILIFH